MEGSCPKLLPTSSKTMFCTVLLVISPDSVACEANLNDMSNNKLNQPLLSNPIERLLLIEFNLFLNNNNSFSCVLPFYVTILATWA